MYAMHGTYVCTCMCVYAYMYVCVNVGMICIFGMHVCWFSHKLHVCMYVFMYVCVSRSVYLCRSHQHIHTCIYTYIHTYIYMYIYIYTYIYIYIYYMHTRALSTTKGLRVCFPTFVRRYMCKLFFSPFWQIMLVYTARTHTHTHTHTYTHAHAQARHCQPFQRRRDSDCSFHYPFRFLHTPEKRPL